MKINSVFLFLWNYLFLSDCFIINRFKLRTDIKLRTDTKIFYNRRYQLTRPDYVDTMRRLNSRNSTIQNNSILNHGDNDTNELNNNQIEQCVKCSTVLCAWGGSGRKPTILNQLNPNNLFHYKEELIAMNKPHSIARCKNQVLQNIDEYIYNINNVFILG